MASGEALGVLQTVPGFFDGQMWGYGEKKLATIDGRVVPPGKDPYPPSFVAAGDTRPVLEIPGVIPCDDYLGRTEHPFLIQGHPVCEAVVVAGGYTKSFGDVLRETGSRALDQYTGAELDEPAATLGYAVITQGPDGRRPLRLHSGSHADTRGGTQFHHTVALPVSAVRRFMDEIIIRDPRLARKIAGAFLGIALSDPRSAGGLPGVTIEDGRTPNYPVIDQEIKEAGSKAAIGVISSDPRKQTRFQFLRYRYPEYRVNRTANN